MKEIWKATTIGAECDFRGGGTPSTTTERYWTGNIPWVSPKDMKSEVISDSADHISKEAINNSAASMIPRESVLIVVRSGILGRTIPLGITGREVTINQDVKALYPKNGLNSWFLYYLLQANSDFLLSRVTRGATVHRLTTDSISSLPFGLPSASEQQRIVAILDKAFNAIAAAKANAEKNLQNARALFDSHLEAVFSRPEKEWVEKSMEESADPNCTLSYGIVQPGQEYPNGLPIVRPTDLTTRVIQLDGLKRINPKLAQAYRRTSLIGGELLLCVRGSTGVVSIAAPDLKGSNVTRGIVPIRFNPALLKPIFGFYLLTSTPVQSQIREKTYGAALMQINIRDLRNVVLHFPPLKKQDEIVTKLDALYKNTERLESIYQQKLAALESLKKSLLYHAFSGQL